jgi:hypothetical protein
MVTVGSSVPAASEAAGTDEVSCLVVGATTLCASVRPMAPFQRNDHLDLTSFGRGRSAPKSLSWR